MEKPTQTTLTNGIRVILLENHTAPVVSWNLWANVGSVNEKNNEAGLCHLIEHMLFKGTGRRPVGQIAKEVEAAGGDMNAYTSFDETVFYINMSSKKWEIGLDVLADAATDPTFDEEELTREKEVVVEEISRGEDNPSQMVSQDLFAKAFAKHHYGRPIAGDRNTVRGVSREYLIEFYRRWYVGSNLIFIGVGDFNTAEILSKIESLFSKIPVGIPPSQDLPAEPVQTEGRVITRAMEIEGRYLDLGLPATHLTHPDTPTLDVLAHILGGGNSSRLELTIKEKKQLVTSIGAYPYTPRHPCLFIIGAILKEKTLHETIKNIWEEVEKLKISPPTTVEFARARENIRSTRIYERQTVEAMARKLGFFGGIAGNLSFEDDYYRRLSEITPQDVQRTAQKYLIQTKMTLSFCHPKNEKWSEDQIKSWITKLAPAPKLPKSGNKKSASGVELFTLKSGVRLLVRENHNLPIISLRSASLGGIRSETLKTNGISHLLSQLLTKATSHRTFREIAEEIENLSGHIDGYMGRNVMGVQGSFLSEKMAEGFEIFFDLLFHPSFPEDEIQKEKELTYTAIRNEEDSLSHVAMKKFLEGLYGKHPYGFPVLGTRTTVKSFTQKDFIRFYQALVHPDNLVIAVTGDIDALQIRERFEEKIESFLSDKHLPKKSISAPLPLKTLTQPLKIITKKKKLQAHIVYGFRGTTLLSPDRYSLEVLNYVLSGQGGRLFIELRDKQGLAYTVSSSSHEGIEPGYFMVYMGTDPAKLETALSGIRLELDKIRTDLVSQEELERAKRFIIGSYDLDLQKNATVASLIAFNEIYGLGRDELILYTEKIERVTRQDILRVAKKYIRPEASVLSIITS